MMKCSFLHVYIMFNSLMCQPLGLLLPLEFLLLLLLLLPAPYLRSRSPDKSCPPKQAMSTTMQTCLTLDAPAAFSVKRTAQPAAIVTSPSACCREDIGVATQPAGKSTAVPLEACSRENQHGNTKT